MTMKLVVFHMDGCPHCKAVTGPDSALRAVRDLVSVYEVEAREPLAQRLEISSFPTILLSTPFVAFKYEGNRTPEDLRRFVLEKRVEILQRPKAFETEKKKSRQT